MVDPQNQNEYDDEAYLTALNALTVRLEDEVQEIVAALWAAGGTPGDIRNEFEEVANTAILEAANPKPHVGGGPKKTKQ